MVATLLLTAVGSFAAQVNAWILRYTVDNINELIIAQKTLRDGTGLLIFISTVLVGKELVYSAVQFGQKFFGEKLRIFISRDHSFNIEKIAQTFE